jgi:glycosyltransferase involved in cell wall biosynthesis
LAIHAKRIDVLVVDDGSTDDTASHAEAAGAMVLRLPLNLGVGGAMRAGFRFAVDNHYTSVVQIDADGQHPVDQICNLVKAAQQHDAHLVIGSRYLSPDATLTPTAPRRWAMRVLSKLVFLTTGKTITDSTSGFRIIREPLLSDFAREFPSYYLGDTFEATVAAIRRDYTVTEIPARLSPRLGGKPSSTFFHSVLSIVKVSLIVLMRLNGRARRRT